MFLLLNSFSSREMLVSIKRKTWAFQVDPSSLNVPRHYIIITLLNRGHLGRVVAKQFQRKQIIRLSTIGIERT